MTDKIDIVAAIAASLYASRATDDAIRAEPPVEALADEAWDLYYKLERAVRSSTHRDGEAAHAQPDGSALRLPTTKGDGH